MKGLIHLNAPVRWNMCVQTRLDVFCAKRDVIEEGLGAQSPHLRRHAAHDFLGLLAFDHPADGRTAHSGRNPQDRHNHDHLEKGVSRPNSQEGATEPTDHGLQADIGVETRSTFLTVCAVRKDLAAIRVAANPILVRAAPRILRQASIEIGPGPHGGHGFI